MLALRTALQKPNDYAITDKDVVQIIKEWGQLKTLELRSWYLLQIQGAIEAQILDVNLFLSISVNNVRDWNDLSLVGWGLRLGGNPNLYVQSELGPCHIIVYAVTQARIHKVSTQVTDVLCIMFIIQGASLGSPAYDVNGGYTKTKKEEPSYNKAFVSQIEKSFKSPTMNEKKEQSKEVRTVEMWLRSQAVQPLDDYREVLKNMGNRVPSLVGACLDNIDIAYLIPGEIPTFEFLISTRATSLFSDYPLNNGGDHIHIRSGEVVGMIQAIQGSILEAFMLFINSGVQCSYFTVNRLCRHLADAVENEDPLSRDILLEMLTVVIRIGTTLDTDQFNILQSADDDLGASVEQVYSEPMWAKTCNAPLNTPVTEPMKQLAFGLGLNPENTRQQLCDDFAKMSMADVETLKNNAIARQQNRIANTVITIAEFLPSKENKGCDNGQNRQIKPEEYNDTSLVFYRDGEQVLCYTSDMFEDMVSSRKDPVTKKNLTPELVRQIDSQVDVIKSIGLDPARPVSISESVNKLSQKDTINSVETDFAVFSVKQILKSQNLEGLDVKKINVDELNRILDSIRMKQDMLPKLTAKHQINTFYMAIYYALRMDPSKTRVFLENYRMKNFYLTPKNPIKKTVSGTPVLIVTPGGTSGTPGQYSGAPGQYSGAPGILVSPPPTSSKKGFSAKEVEDEEEEEQKSTKPSTKSKSSSKQVVLVEEARTPTRTEPLTVPTVTREVSTDISQGRSGSTLPVKTVQQAPPPEIPRQQTVASQKTVASQQFAPPPGNLPGGRLGHLQQRQLTPGQKEAVSIQNEQQNIIKNEAKLRQDQNKVIQEQQALIQEKQALTLRQQQFEIYKQKSLEQQQIAAQQAAVQQAAQQKSLQQQQLAAQQAAYQKSLQQQQQLAQQQQIAYQKSLQQQAASQQQQQQIIQQQQIAYQKSLQQQQLAQQQTASQSRTQQQLLQQSELQKQAAYQKSLQQQALQQQALQQQQIAYQKSLQQQQQALQQSQRQFTSQQFPVQQVPVYSSNQVYLPSQQQSSRASSTGDIYIPTQTASSRNLSNLPPSTYNAGSPITVPPSSIYLQEDEEILSSLEEEEEEISPLVPGTPRSTSPTSVFGDEEEEEYI